MQIYVMVMDTAPETPEHEGVTCTLWALPDDDAAREHLARNIECNDPAFVYRMFRLTEAQEITL